LQAQSVRGTVIEQAGAPVRGALVVLLDEAGGQRAGALSGERGEFAISAPAPGRYSLRVQRIGFVDGAVPVFELRRGEALHHTLRMHPGAIELEGITVQARRRCTVRPQDGLIVARLWEEARKALRANVFTEDQRLHGYQIRDYRRMLDAESLRVLRDSALVRESFGQSPYVSLAVDSLLRHGFIQPTQAGPVYYAPDAQVLLSDAFEDAYCFRLARRRPETEGLIGVTFEPVGRRGPPAVRGTVWLDRESYELRWLEYTYARGLSRHDQDGRIGGRVEFEPLATGAWIVRRWWIRMPASSRQGLAWRGSASGHQEQLSLMLEEGGEVLEVRSASLGHRPLAAPAVLAGMVYDSANAGPLGGALVYLSGTSYSDTTDARGRFRLERLPAGEYEIAFSHPELLRLNVHAKPVAVNIRSGEQRSIELSLPLTARVDALAEACASDPMHGEKRPGVLIGRVLDELTSAALPGARVTASWTSYGLDEHYLTEHREVVTAVTRPDGSFIVCGLPLTRTLHVRGTFFEQRGALLNLGILGDTAFAEHDVPIRVTQP
jgi:hypothetical protein